MAVSPYSLDMPSRISGSSLPQSISAAELNSLLPNAASAPAGAASFPSFLQRMVGEVNSKQEAASASVNGLLSGQDVQLHQAMIAVEEANISFQLMVEVRNRLLESYQEIMRMQV